MTTEPGYPAKCYNKSCQLHDNSDSGCVNRGVWMVSLCGGYTKQYESKQNNNRTVAMDDILLVIKGDDLFEVEIETNVLDSHARDTQLCLNVGREVVAALKRAYHVDGAVVTVTACAK